MSYFLKKTKLKRGTYLQIYDGFYDPERKETVHRSKEAVGYVEDLKKSGIKDPIAHYQNIVDKMNEERKLEKEKEKNKKISDSNPERYLGYFPLKNINDSLGAKRFIDIMQLSTDFNFNVYSLLSSLIYARAVMPCSKSRTYEEVFPKLFEPCNFSLNQIYDGLEYIGSEYEKIIEIYNVQIAKKYKFDTSNTYFDCTNFYFEIDREDDFRKKGCSKENRMNPIVGLGLLLDSNQIPMAMKVYPGNGSEKPVMREVIEQMKLRHKISGRTIRVADKGLNCIDNILHARLDGDGYIFSKSVKNMSDVEKTWVLLDNDYRDVRDKDGKLSFRIKECVDDFPYKYTDEEGHRRTVRLREKRIVTYNPKLAKKKQLEILKEVNKALNDTTSQAKRDTYKDRAKFIKFVSEDKNGKETDDKVKIEINEEAVNEAMELAGYNIIVTSETKMKDTEIYYKYHNLWRIEETFKVMKSQLDARPVYLQKKNRITGHFLVCYFTVVLTRLLQFKELKNEYNTETLTDFFRKYRVVKESKYKYINMTRQTSFIDDLAEQTKLLLNSYYLNKSDITKMLNHRFNS